MRVAYVYRHFSRRGSIPSVFYRNATRLAEDEDVTAVCSAASREATDAPLRFETVEPLVTGRGRFRYALECGSFAIRATRALERRRDCFDVVHSEGIAALRADLVTVHGVRPAELEHYFSAVEPQARARRVLAPVLRPQTGVVRLIERSLFKPPYPLCITISDGIARDLQRHYGVPDDAIEVIRYGIDMEAFAPSETLRDEVRGRRGTPGERLVMLFVGDDFERKGLRTAIEALDLVVRDGVDAELWVAGAGASSPFAAHARSLGIAQRVHFLGWCPQPLIRELYTAADTLVLPTRQDAWGQPVVEALASGCVPLVSEFAGAHEVVTHGENGFVLSRAGAPAEIAAHIGNTLVQAHVRRQISAAGRAAVRDFDPDIAYVRLREAHHRAFERRLRLSKARPGDRSLAGSGRAAS